MTDDVKFMEHALELAQKGMGAVSPNPLVGCVLVADGRIIGEGYHASYGGPHAEVNAIDSVKDEDKHLLCDATLYVNLEPCSHVGKTPPCADYILKMGIPRVVFASDDPNPLVAGAGMHKLTQGGVEVTVGTCKKEADFLNRRFFTAMTHHRPYIILKFAQSTDGFMAPKEEKQLWLTGEEAKKLTHTWRREEDAILVGLNTVLVDDPELTVRLVEGRDPYRAVVDQKLILPSEKKIFNGGAPVFVYNETEDSVTENVHRIKIDFTGDVLEQILFDLYLRKVRSVIVEGGPKALAGFAEKNLWDEARIFTAPQNLTEGKKAPVLTGTILKEETLGEDKLVILIK